MYNIKYLYRPNESKFILSKLIDEIVEELSNFYRKYVKRGVTHYKIP